MRGSIKIYDPFKLIRNVLSDEGSVKTCDPFKLST